MYLVVSKIIQFNSYHPYDFSPLYLFEDSPSGSATQAEKEEVDSRSIYVGNVRVNYPVLIFIYLIAYNCEELGLYCIDIMLILYND